MYYFILLFVTTNHSTPPQRVAPRSQWYAVSSLHTPGTPCHARCKRTSCQKTWLRIPQFFSLPFSVSCRALTLPCITTFFDDTSLPGPLTLSTCPRYPSSASTRSPGSRWCLKHWLKILMSLYVPAGYGPCIHTRFPAMMSTPSSYRTADLPAYLWDAKVGPFWGIRKSVPSIVIVQSLSMSCGPSLLSKSIWGWQGGVSRSITIIKII